MKRGVWNFEIRQKNFGFRKSKIKHEKELGCEITTHESSASAQLRIYFEGLFCSRPFPNFRRRHTWRTDKIAQQPPTTTTQQQKPPQQQQQQHHAAQGPLPFPAGNY